MLILVSGGAGSGKSAFAESLVTSSGLDRRIYLATMQVAPTGMKRAAEGIGPPGREGKRADEGIGPYGNETGR